MVENRLDSLKSIHEDQEVSEEMYICEYLKTKIHIERVRVREMENKCKMIEIREWGMS